MLINKYLTNERLLAALCIWREARGESFRAKLGVFWVLKNRCSVSPREGFKKTLTENILKKWAFSSFNENDPNYSKYPEDSDDSWVECLQAVDSPDPDPTDLAVFYYSKPLTAPPAAWGNVENTANIGGLHFYSLPRTKI
jgi:hypothetical protein